MKPEKVLDSDAADFREKANELFEKGEDKEVEDVVNGLCEKGIITSKMTTFNLYNKDGTLKSSTPARILVLRDADRVNEVVNFHCLFSGCAQVVCIITLLLSSTIKKDSLIVGKISLKVETPKPAIFFLSSLYLSTKSFEP